MPRVPTYDTPQVSPSTLPQVQVASPRMPDVAGQQAQQMGQAMMGAGQQLGRVALDMQQEANQLRVTDALNKAKEQALRLAYDKDIGYLGLKGVNALERPGGKPLADEYGETLEKELSNIAMSLGNDTQRRMFQANAAAIAQNFRGNIMQHEAKEYETYALSVSEGVQATALREIALSWNDPASIDKAVNRIKSEVYRQAQLTGKSAEWQEARARQMTSRAHLTALGAALDNNDVLYADGYLKKYGSQMEGDDLLRVRGLITKEMDMRVGTAIGQQVFAGFSPAITPTDYDRLQSIVTSDGGQLEDSESLNGLLKQYSGDVVKTLAATKIGSKEVDKLIKAHGNEWTNHLSASARDYVQRASADFGAGAGKPPKPTLAEMKAALRQRPELAGNPLRLKHAEDALELQFKAVEAATKQREEENLDQVYKALYANGGNMSALAPGVRAAIPGEKLDNVLNFARSVSRGEPMRNNPEAWASILSLPKEALAKMTPVDFYRQFRPVLDDAHLEKGYALLAEAQNAPNEKHLEIITTDQRMKQAAIGAGILPAEGKASENEVKQFAQFQQIVDQRVRQFERTDLQGKRKATSEELQRVIDSVLTDKAFVPRPLWFDRERPVALLEADQQARAYVTVAGEEITLAAIPQTQRALIASKLQARGLPVSEQTIAELWVRAGKPKE